MTKHKVESAGVRRLVRARPQQCYYNSFHVIVGVPDYAKADYVEGLVVRHAAFVIEHG